MQMKTEQVILTRGLPKTGQITSYRFGDDGYRERGWWKGLGVEDNRTRFVVRAIDSHIVIIDNATGLMWAAEGAGIGCFSGGELPWTAALDHINGLNWCGYEDWQMPNIYELMSIVNFGGTAPLVYTGFSVKATDEYWSSTSLPSSAGTQMYAVHFGTGTVASRALAATNYLRSVRYI